MIQVGSNSSHRGNHHRVKKTMSGHALFAREESVIFGSNVERMRIEQGISIQRFAMMVGLSRPTIYKIERGEMDPKLSVVRQVADALGTTVQELLAPYEPIR